MVNKKAIGGQLDWIIGMGIFLIYLGLTITFFKPGITPIFNSDTLLDIAEENFRGDFTWEIEKTPLFLETIYYNDSGLFNELNSGDYSIKLKGKLEPGGSIIGNFVISNFNFENYSVFYVPKDPNLVNPNDLIYDGRNQIQSNIRVSTSLLKPEANLKREYYILSNGLDTINVPINPTEKQKLLLLEGEKINDKYNPLTLPATINACLIPDFNSSAKSNSNENYGYPTIYNPSKNKNCQIRYEIGIKDKLTGINLIKFDNLNVNTYEQIKEKWGYPKLKEFKIILDSENLVNPIEFPNNELPLDVDIYSRYFNSFILTEDGLRIPIGVNILIW